MAQLAGYVSEHSAYHHGEASLSSTIVGLAQNFVGSNNVNLLYPSGGPIRGFTPLKTGKTQVSFCQLSRDHALHACLQAACAS